MYSVQYIPQSCTTLPFNVMSDMPSFKRGYATSRGTCLLKLEAANAHKTNSSAGKRKCLGMCSSSQKWRNCLIVPVYRLRVELAHPP